MKGSADLDLLLFGEAEGDEAAPAPVPPAETGERGTSDAGKNPNEARQRFRELMEGEFKEEFTAYFNEIFQRRFKEQREELRLARAVVDAARARYGTEELERLADVIRADSAEEAPTETVQPQEICEDRETETLDVRIREEVARAVAAARATAEHAVLETIRARGMRPLESALSDCPASRGEPAHLTRAERAEVALRAAKGERITL